LPTLDLIKKDC